MSTSTPTNAPPPDASTATTAAAQALTPIPARPHWIEHWDPEDPVFWEATGRHGARRNLIWSIVAEHLGFSVWLLWSIVVVQMGATATGAAGPAGFALTLDQQLWLVAVPSGVGAFLRLPYTFAVPLFGGRNWTVISALLLVIPCGLLAWAVSDPSTSYATLLIVAATAGFGGGNFASSMTNISFFYPEREKGWALGLNAAGGNIGVAVVQKLAPVVITLGGGIALARAGLLYIPLVVIAAVCAFLFMDNLAEAKSDPGAVAAAAKRGQTWIMSFLYIGTFGSFIGYSAAFPALIKAPKVFDNPEFALAWGFLGAFVGSVARPLGGKLSDRVGGARVTAFAFALMTLGAVGALYSVQNKEFGLFIASFLVLFVATGLGNGSTYRMIPAIFRRLGQEGGATADSMRRARREAAGAIGISSAVGAFGGFIVPIAYAQSNKHLGSIVPALRFYVVFFLVMLAVTWFCYLRRGSHMAKSGV
jgi:NNP family nitrate/nitrite transporter-like MFS transporter